MKLKGGCGDQVLVIMTQLATKALKRKNFSFKKPKYEDPSAPEETEAEEQRNPNQDDEEMIDEA